MAYDDINPENGERVLTYILEVAGTPYRVVLQLPFSAVLETATSIASPLLVVQLLGGVLLLFALPFFTGRIIQPLNTLAEAANRIASGNLRIPVDISGEDEVAQVGQAFEQMRLGLRARLNDLSLLLTIAQRAAATLDLERGMQPILEGALAETGATVRPFILLRSGDSAAASVPLWQEATPLLNLIAPFPVAMRRAIVAINDLDAGAKYVAAARDLGSVAIFPVHIRIDRRCLLGGGDDP
jgi:HAMP domain-containing protein